MYFNKKNITQFCGSGYGSGIASTQWLLSIILNSKENKNPQVGFTYIFFKIRTWASVLFENFTFALGRIRIRNFLKSRIRKT